MQAINEQEVLILAYKLVKKFAIFLNIESPLDYAAFIRLGVPPIATTLQNALNHAHIFLDGDSCTIGFTRGGSLFFDTSRKDISLEK